MFYYAVAPVGVVRRPTYTYASAKKLRPGQVVWVNLAGGRRAGIVLAEDQTLSTAKHIDTVAGVTFSQTHLALAQWCSDQYLAPLGLCLKLLMPPKLEKASMAKQEAARPVSPGQTILLTHTRRLAEYEQHLSACLKSGQGVAVVTADLWSSQYLAEQLGQTQPAVEQYHSAVAPSERMDIWNKVAGDRPIAVVGSRAVLWLPWQNLGLIIIDEEDDLGHKEERTPRYHSRSIAAKIGQLTGARLVIGTETPSLEAYLAYRPAAFSRPDARVRTVSTGNHQSLLSYESWQAVREALEAGRAIGVYVPRRYQNQLTAELTREFGSDQVGLFDPEKQEFQASPQALDSFKSGKRLIMLGGQSLTKAPEITAELMIGIGLDLILQLPDFRSGEKARSIAQKLLNRTTDDGQLIIQTDTPDHPLFSELRQPWPEFAERELRERKALRLPPYRRLTNIRFESERAAQAAARRLARYRLTDHSVSQQPSGWHILSKDDPGKLARAISRDWDVEIDPITAV